MPARAASAICALLIFPLLIVISFPARSQGIEKRIYMLNDFDYNTAEWCNDFFGLHGVWEYGAAHLTASYPSVAGYHHELRLVYDVTAPSSAGGWWELFTYSYSDPNTPLYDLSRFSEFHFSVRSEPGSTTRMYLEFTQGNFEKTTRVEITGIGTTMREYVIPLATALTGFDRKRMKSVAAVLEQAHVTATTGALVFDNLYFVAEEERPSDEDALLEVISRRAFQYFLENTHPVTGLVRDRASTTDLTSIAAVGFQLAAMGIGAERRWITRPDAAARTEKILRTLLYSKHDSSTSGTIGYRGFFYHMLDLSTATRTWNSELSSIDASLCLAGVIFAREYFDSPSDAVEAAIRRMADSVYHRFDWQWMMKRNQNVFYMAWKPESGFDVYTWDYLTDETILVCLLAIGSGQVDPSVFYAWQRRAGTYHGLSCYQTWWGSLFTYFFAQCWIPGEQLGSDRGQPNPVNWWQNSAAAALASRQFCIDSSGRYRTYSDSSWGLTACFGPGGYNGGSDKSYGAAPLGDPPANHDGTIAPYGAGSCINFFSKNPAMNEAVTALRNYYNNYPKLWGLYGLKDAYNLGTLADTTDDWYTDDYVGIDSGPLLVMIENYRSGLVWNCFSRNEQIRAALRLVFRDTLTSGLHDKPFLPYKPILDQNHPNPFNPKTVVSYQLPVVSNVRLVVYDLLGREVAVLVNEKKGPGSYLVEFNASGLASGVYICRMTADQYVASRKMLLMK